MQNYKCFQWNFEKVNKFQFLCDNDVTKIDAIKQSK